MAARIRICLLFVLAVGWLNPGAPGAAGAHALDPAVAHAGTRPNLILLIGIDALRADHLPDYGYFRQTTPSLDAFLSAQGAVFVDTTSPASWTFPANGAVHTGVRPFRLGMGWYPYDYPIPPSATTLAEYLHDAGYLTAGFITNGFVSHYAGLEQGFDVFDETLLAYPHEDPGCAGLLTDRVISWTEQLTRPGPLFLFAWYLDPHTWYNSPPPYDIMYDPTYTGTLTAAAYGDGHGYLVTTPRDLQHLKAMYDGEISYTDEQIGRLLAYLDGREMLNDALVVVYSDHGDQFGEHDRWVHGNTIYEELVRVPFMIRYPGMITPGSAITTPVQTLDIFPTILDYAGIPVPPGLDGISLRPLLEGNPPPVARPIYTEIESMTDPSHFGYGYIPMVDMRSIRLGDWKYIHHVTHAWDDELYYLNPASQYETDNLLLAEPARAAAMRQQLQNYYMINFAYLPALVRTVP